MIEIINVTRNLAMPADRVWSAIAQIGGLDRWFPVITDCRVIGSGVGATRILTLTSGEKIRDRIELIDHLLRRFQYNRTESPFPVNRYLGTVDIHASAESSCEISWTVEIDVLDEKRDEMVHFVKHALTEGINGLEQNLLSLAAMPLR